MDDDEDIAWIREDTTTQVNNDDTKPEVAVVPTPIITIQSAPTPPPTTDIADEFNYSNEPEPAQSVNNPPPTTENVQSISTTVAPAPDSIPNNENNSQSGEKSTSSDCSKFDINEYEKKLNATTHEALKLLDQIGAKSTQLIEQNKQITQDLTVQNEELLNQDNSIRHKTIEDHVQVPTISQLPSGGLPRNVESVLIGGLEAVTGCVVLPTGLILITDAVQGIQLFDIEGNVVRKVSNPDWHNPRSPLSHKDHILLLADVKIEGEYLRHILKFTANLEYVAKIEGPQWLVGRNILSDRLSIAHTDYLYLSACGQISSAIYELSPVGQWTELDFRQSESYIDMLAFATIGTITQLLVVEGRKNYVLQLSIRESQVVDRRRLAICQRPGALAKDDAGRLFVADKATACIHLVDTVQWVSDKNLACTESVVPYFNAKWGLLAIPVKTAVRLQKYSFR